MTFLATVFAALAIFVIVARLLFPLPNLAGRSRSAAIAASDDTELGRWMIEKTREHPGRSGVVPLANGHDALSSRIALIDAAQRSIDAQYYIWHADTSGLLLLKALHRAAQRGVRVRLLLDDNGIHGMDDLVAALDAQPNIEVRLFNPSTVRRPKLLGYAFDFFRMNRRMHNKSLTVDGAATIVGGRNIGDEYFKVGDEAFFVDMDVLATGTVVPEVQAAFDDYWNSASAFEVGRIVTVAPDLEFLHSRIAAVEGSAKTLQLSDQLHSSTQRLRSGDIVPEWTRVELVVDDPTKGTGATRKDQLMITRLARILGEVEQRLDLASAYFIPGTVGSAYFERLARRGKSVKVLTNAMNTTDVLVVHAGYARYRRKLLQAGVRLYELKLRGPMSAESDRQIRPLGLSGASLHAKTFAVDGRRVFIGSFNFDPRSALLNCEMGFLIDSVAMATHVHEAFDRRIALVSYRPQLTPEDKMVWTELVDGQDAVTYQEEPGASWFQQIALVIVGLLPVEWLL